jgi:hypothetical protein
MSAGRRLEFWLALVALGSTFSAISRGQTISVKQQFRSLTRIGSGNLDHGPTSIPTQGNPQLEFSRVNLDAKTGLASIKKAPPASEVLTVPVVPNREVLTSNPNAVGFDGLDHADQRFAGTGIYANSQFSTEPPDQGLCVGNSFVLETINTALAVYSTTGTPLAGPTALNQFFGLAPEVIRSSPPVFGDFIADPRCHYDADTNRFFVTLTQISTDPATGAMLPKASLLIAVSQTGDPTGAWNVFQLDVTNDGFGCPCFGDQPLIGFDAYGLFISTNAFPILSNGYGGVQIYAMSKSALAAGTLPPFVLLVSLPPAFNPDGSFNFSVHPANNTRGQEKRHLGTEFFLSSYDITSFLNAKVTVWALQGTAQLNSPPTPSTQFGLFELSVPSEVYGVPPDAFQKIGTLPLGSLIQPGVLEVLATNEHRMQQVTYANGLLWSSVTTVMSSSGENSTKAGVAWFAVSVETGAAGLQAAMNKQGYLGLHNANLFFPAVGPAAAGTAAIGFTVSGLNYFPSTGYVQIDTTGKVGPVRLIGIGVNSEDGFTGYPNAVSVPPPCFQNNSGTTFCEARWGDYGASDVDANGNIWLGNEYIGPRPRSANANWGTFITQVNP